LRLCCFDFDRNCGGSDSCCVSRFKPITFPDERIFLSSELARISSGLSRCESYIVIQMCWSIIWLTAVFGLSAAHTGEHRRMTAHADTYVSGFRPVSHGPAQGEIALSLTAPDGSGVWALTICPARSSGSTSSPPWTFRLHDPQGTAHELVAGKRDDSVLLHRAPNPWRPFSLRRRYGADGDHDAVDDEDEWREVVRRKVTALLNKLTAGNLDTISKQIIEWANESEHEEDARTVKLVVQLVLDAARVVPHLSGMYARLCYRITSRPVGSRVKGDIPIDVHRTPPSGSALFSNLLFDLIKKDFGIMPFSAEQCQTTVTSKVAAAHDGIDRRHGVGVPSRQRKATRRGYGLAVLVATLVKLGEYAEDVLLMLVRELLDTIISHKDSQDIECLCTLLSIAGHRLETRSSKESLNRHLSRMKKLSKSRRVRPRERFMLEDVIERRKWGWIPPLPLTPRSDRATGQKPSSQSQMDPMASPQMPPAQSLPGGMQPGMPPAPMRGWFYPPPHGSYVDPNWAAAYDQWYMPQQGPNAVASPPGTPASATIPVPGGRLNQSAAPLTPSSPARKITLRAKDGSEIKFDKFGQKGQQAAASPATPTVTGSRRSVKIEKRT
ncbi:ARM repeat-containing protein, partial [Schizophyllum commune Loenen D]